MRSFYNKRMYGENTQIDCIEYLEILNATIIRFSVS